MIDNWDRVSQKWHEKDTIPFHVPYHLGLYAEAFLAFDWSYQSKGDLLFDLWRANEDDLFSRLLKDRLSEDDWDIILGVIQFHVPLDSLLFDNVCLFKARVDRALYFNR